MCFYDIKVFEDCQCTAFGAFRKACFQGEAKGEPCGQRFVWGRLQMIYNAGKCKKCQEIDGITNEQEESEQPLAETLIHGNRPALEDVSSVFLSVYEAIRVKRQWMRLRRFAKSVKGDAKSPQPPSESQNSSSQNVATSSFTPNRATFMQTMEVDVGDVSALESDSAMLPESSYNPLEDYGWPQPLSPPRVSHTWQEHRTDYCHQDPDAPWTSIAEGLSEPLGSTPAKLAYAGDATATYDPWSSKDPQTQHILTTDLSGETQTDPSAQVGANVNVQSAAPPYLSTSCNAYDALEDETRFGLVLDDSAPVATQLTDLRQLKSNAWGFRGGLQLHDDGNRPCASKNTEPSSVQLSRIRLYETNEKFLLFAKKAHDKLRCAAISNTVSNDFRRFYKALGDLEDILQAGLDTLEKLLDGGIPRSLKEMYSFLHVAYAMSQAESEAVPALEDLELASGILILKRCLPNEPAIGNKLSEQDLFDEIVRIMWDELQDALAWIKQQNFDNVSVFAKSPEVSDGQELHDILKWSAEQSAENIEPTLLETSMTDFDILMDQDVGMEGYIYEGTQKHQPTTPAQASDWKELVTTKVFSHVVHFLKALDNIGTVFLYLCGTFYSALGTESSKTLMFYKDYGPQKQKYPADNPDIDPRELEVQDHIIENIINPLKQDNSVGSRTASVAKHMLRVAPVGGLPDFEYYLIGLIRVRQRAKQEFAGLVRLILSLCQRCYHGLPMRCKSLDSIPLLYSNDYVERRTYEEEKSYSNEEECISNTLTPIAHATDSPNQLNIFGLNLTGESEMALDSLWCNSDQEYASPSSFSTSSRCSAYSMPPPSRKRSNIAIGKPRISQVKKRRVPPERRLYECTFAGCTHRDTTESNLKRHHLAEHGDESVKTMVYTCDVPGCKAQRTGARALENIKTHKKSKHGIGGRKDKGTLLDL